MRVDPPKDESLDRLLQEVGRTLQENQRFLAALQQDQVVGDDFDSELVSADDEEFEEL